MSPASTLRASQSGLQFDSHFLAPGQNRAALEARKAEVTRPFRSGDHKSSTEDSLLASTSRQGCLLSGGGVGVLTSPPHTPPTPGLAVMKQGTN